MKTEFTPQALADLDDIYAWIERDDPRTAERVISRIRQTTSLFEDFPMIGHPGAVEGTREFKVRGLPYLIVYAITTDDIVDIVTIIHGRRNYPGDHVAG